MKTAKTYSVPLAGKPYKVRAYHNEDEATRIVDLMSPVSHRFVRCCGRLGRYLVLERVDGTELSRCANPMGEIANFLSELNAVETAPVTRDQCKVWCRQLANRRLFLPVTTERLYAYFRRQVLRPIRWSLQYDDPHPRNFLWAGGQSLICVDEKHLISGPGGHSLRAASHKLAPHDYAQLKHDYLDRTLSARAESDPCPNFVSFFHSISNLVLLARSNPSRLLQQLNAIHWHRTNVMRSAGIDSGTIRLEELRWLVSTRLRSHIKRIRRFTRRKLGGQVTSSPAF